ncbi:MAG TPA: hypothetical protein VMR41_02470 [Patescibacteria group bacterium]|nr:hypothetical protein [Patescibacteria group bacterium]
MPRLIDWNEIYSHYISSESTTLKDCSQKFDVSHDVIRQHASSEQWSNKKAQVLRAALSLIDARTAEEVSKRNTEHIQIARAMIGVAAKKMADGIEPKDAKDIKEWVATAIDIERKALGMDEKVTPRVEMTNKQGQKMILTWGDGKPLKSYDEERRKLQLP